MKSRRKRAEAEWRKVIEGWQESGLSIRRYCREQGIRESRFYWWRKQLDMLSGGKQGLPGTKTAESEAIIKFLPVQVKESKIAESFTDKTSAGNERVDIFLPNGSVVRLNSNISEGKLSAIMKMVAGASC